MNKKKSVGMYCCYIMLLLRFMSGIHVQEHPVYLFYKTAYCFGHAEYIGCADKVAIVYNVLSSKSELSN